MGLGCATLGFVRLKRTTTAVFSKMVCVSLGCATTRLPLPWSHVPVLIRVVPPYSKATGNVAESPVADPVSPASRMRGTHRGCRSMSAETVTTMVLEWHGNGLLCRMDDVMMASRMCMGYNWMSSPKLSPVIPTTDMPLL